MLDAIYPSSNEWDVPDLVLSRCPSHMTPPFRAWGSVARTSRMTGTWHFYIDDKKFSALWKKPDQPKATACDGLVEPNYTMGDQVPRCLLFRFIYQKRWLARRWQDLGLNVFVDCNVDACLFDIAFLGVPKGWTAFATRGADKDLPLLETQFAKALDIADGNQITFIVYSGGPKTEAWCRANGAIWVRNHREGWGDG